MTGAPAFSIVIPAYDEEAELPSTLESVRVAADDTGRPYELIVVDDASTDRTGEIARAAGAHVERVECRQIAAVRNAGARVARADVLVFVDADTRIDANAISVALEAIERGAVGGGARVAFDDELSMFAKSMIVPFMTMLRWFKIAPGCFIFVKRSAYEAVGGFDETLYAGEEIRFSRRIRKHGRFVIIRAGVVSSSRKERLYPAPYLLWKAFTLGIFPWMTRKRDGLDVWYDGRRETVIGEGAEGPRD